VVGQLGRGGAAVLGIDVAGVALVGRPSGQALRDIGTSDRREGPLLRGRCYKTFWLRTGPCRALGADPPRDAELRGDLACRRLGSERKYVKRIHARDTGKAGRQFAR
jgi:hypothetical protein